jgi:two-component system, NarL family, sensor histidine kinase DevS
VALRTRTTHRLEVDINRARFDQHGLGQLGVSAAAGPVVPLMFHGQTYGALIALDRLQDGPAFAAGDQAVLEGFATSAAISVATARSAASELRRQRVAAAEEERGRWARELHDETLQSLAALRLGLSMARRRAGAEVLDEAVVQPYEQSAHPIAVAQVSGCYSTSGGSSREALMCSDRAMAAARSAVSRCWSSSALSSAAA